MMASSYDEHPHRYERSIAVVGEDENSTTAAAHSSSTILPRREQQQPQDHEQQRGEEQRDEQEVFVVSELFLLSLKRDIESMSKEHQIKVLQIFKKDKSVKINSNKSGIYINLSLIPEKVIKEIFLYTTYAKEQEKRLDVDEIQKQIYHASFFSSSSSSAAAAAVPDPAPTPTTTPQLAVLQNNILNTRPRKK